MQHQSQRYKLGRDTNQRAALWYNLVRSLVLHGKIITTHAKACSIVTKMSNLVTLAKEKNLNSYRKTLAFFRGDKLAANKLFDHYGIKFKDRPGGYLRVVKLGQRKGDSAHLSCIMFVD